MKEPIIIPTDSNIHIRTFFADGSFDVIIDEDKITIIPCECFNEVTDIPVFPHDCLSCIYLGRYYGEGSDITVVDTYYCHSSKTRVIRYGKEGVDYESRPLYITEKIGSKYDNLFNRMKDDIERLKLNK